MKSNKHRSLTGNDLSSTFHWPYNTLIKTWVYEAAGLLLCNLTFMKKVSQVYLCLSALSLPACSCISCTKPQSYKESCYVNKAMCQVQFKLLVNISLLTNTKFPSVFSHLGLNKRHFIRPECGINTSRLNTKQTDVQIKFP